VPGPGRGVSPRPSPLPTPRPDVEQDGPTADAEYWDDEYDDEYVEDEYAEDEDDEEYWDDEYEDEYDDDDEGADEEEQPARPARRGLLRKGLLRRRRRPAPQPNPPAKRRRRLRLPTSSVAAAGSSVRRGVVEARAGAGRGLAAARGGLHRGATSTWSGLRRTAVFVRTHWSPAAYIYLAFVGGGLVITLLLYWHSGFNYDECNYCGVPVEATVSPWWLLILPFGVSSWPQWLPLLLLLIFAGINAEIFHRWSTRPQPEYPDWD
jgi:hypothetical protein